MRALILSKRLMGRLCARRVYSASLAQNPLASLAADLPAGYAAVQLRAGSARGQQPGTQEAWPKPREVGVGLGVRCNGRVRRLSRVKRPNCRNQALPADDVH